MDSTNEIYMTGEELADADELLAQIGVAYESMDLSEADGFITGVLLLSEPPKTFEWIAAVLSTNGKKGTTGKEALDRKLVQLLRKRFAETEYRLKNSLPLDPVYYEEEGEDGEILSGKASLVALEPFALGFLESMQKWPELSESGNTKIAAALPGILRHLPEYALGDFAKAKAELDKTTPLADLPEALSDMASCIAEIANQVHGYAIPELDEANGDEA
jgi:yecA family protein